MRELILTNCQAVLADSVVDGTVVVRNGLIAEVDHHRSHLSSAIDCEGDLLVPGLVELHTDNLEGHMLPRPGVHWPADASVMNHDREVAAAGITTVFNALYVGEVFREGIRTAILKEVCPVVRQLGAAGCLKAEHYLHLRCEVSFPAMAKLLEPLIDDPALRLISLNDHTPGQRQFQKIEKYAEYYQGKYGLTDVELQQFMDARIADQQRWSAPNTKAAVAMAKSRGIPLASHDDATAAHVQEAVDNDIVIAEFPTTVEAAEASHRAGIAVLMGGPNIVRGGSHSGNVAARELAERKLLDIISSDYVPASLLFAVFRLQEQVEAITLPQAIAMVSRTPARRIGLDDRGEIAPGLRADLVRVQRRPGAPVIREVIRGGARIA